MKAKYIQIHTLTSYAGVLLNRDESGMGKRLPYGGAIRGRVSSQCKKRHWRMAEDPRSIHALGTEIGAAGVRSREIVEYRVRDTIAGRYPDEVVDVVCGGLVERLYGKAGVDKISSRQALLLGQAEIDWLVTEADSLCAGAADADAAKEAVAAWLKDQSKNLAQLQRQAAMPAGLDAALFGRMVTSDKAASTDAAVMVNHSITIHAEQSELDYFSIVDDLAPNTAGVFDAELNSGLYYGYVVIDVAQLVANTAGVRAADWAGEVDRDVAARAAENLVHLIAKVTPGAKKGSTAPFSRASLVMVEIGDGQPTTLDGAFLDPIPVADRSGVPLGRRAADAMAARMADMDAMYGAEAVRSQAALEGFDIAGVDRTSLPELGTWIAGAIRSTEA
jgi:CRISPR system Cascade subunit CasC